MDLQILLSPLIGTLVLETIGFIFILYWLDRKRATQNVRMSTLIRRRSGKAYRPSWTVLILVDELSLKYVDAQIHNLISQNQSSLEVLLFVDPDVSSVSLSRLRRLRRANRNLIAIRVIKRSSQVDERIALKRYAKNQLVCTLRSGETLSDGFLRRVTLEFFNKNINAVQPSIIPAVDDSMTSAAAATASIVRQSIALLFNRTIRQPVLIRRQAYLRQADISAIRVNYASLLSPASNAGKTNPSFEVMILVLLMGILIFALYAAPFTWHLIVLSSVALISLVVFLQLIESPYTPWTKAGMALLIPIWPLIIVATWAFARTRLALISIATKLSHGPKTQQQKMPGA